MDRGGGHKGASEDTCGTKPPQPQRSAGAHDCEYLILPEADRFLQRSPFLSVTFSRSVRPSIRSTCFFSVFALAVHVCPFSAAGDAPDAGVPLWDLGRCEFPRCDESVDLRARCADGPGRGRAGIARGVALPAHTGSGASPPTMYLLPKWYFECPSC